MIKILKKHIHTKRQNFQDIRCAANKPSEEEILIHLA